MARRHAARREASPRKLGAITLRLEGPETEKLARLARRENRSVKNYVETLIKRHLQAEPEADRVITMHVAPEIAGVEAGTLLRSEGESDARYARRKALFDELMSLPDAE